MTLEMLRAANVFLVTLATPFIQIRNEKSVQRIGILFVLLYSLPLIAAVGAFIRFASLSNAPAHLDNATISAVILLVLAVLFNVDPLWVMYGLAAFGPILIVYLGLGLLLVVVPFFSIFANEATRFKIAGMSFTSASPLENLLISAQGRRTPVVHDPSATVSTLRHKPANPGILSSYLHLPRS
jgi:hypothetical protein